MIDRSVLQTLLAKDLETWIEDRSTLDWVDASVCTFKVQAQLHDLNRKASTGDVPPSLEQAGKDKLLALQERMRGFDLKWSGLASASHFIHQVLPPLEHVWGEVWECCGFGPGTVFHAKRPWEKSLHHKIGGRQSVTPQALPLAISVIGAQFPNWATELTLENVSVVRGNKLGHVPKDVTKCRTIAVEPSLNVFLQKGIGEWLARRLRFMGVANLQDGQEKHRRLVRDDWKSIATLDLSDASDTISVQLVKALLPPDWYELLDRIRSHEFVTREGDVETWHDWYSFSSQGNAFTFPLETLIFWAICKAVGSSAVSVYGDDIIVPTRYADPCREALEACGFSVNPDKSFWGQHVDIHRFFRESCGEDTLFGQPVRSVFYKDDAKDESEVVALMNMLFDKWGFLPLVHGYLGDLCQLRFCGPRYFLASRDGDNGPHVVTGHSHGPIPSMENGIASDESSYLWFEVSDQLGWERPPCFSCLNWQTVSFVLKYWSSRQQKLASRHLISDRIAMLTFLYSGEPWASPVSKPKVRTRVLTVGCCPGLLEETL